MGRYAPTLTAALCDWAGITSGMRVVDVGCGPGGLTRELAARVGADHVAAIDPAPQFAEACRERNPGADVRVGVAEDLPWDDGSFDGALASLVIAFMADADAGLREMARVTRPGGVVSLCMWDVGTGGMTMLRTFWDAARTVDPDVAGEGHLVGMTEGEIAARLRAAGLAEVVDGSIMARAEYADFDDFWDPFTHGVGPVGQYLASVDEDHRARIRDVCREMVPTGGAFHLDAKAWCARGTVPT